MRKRLPARGVHATGQTRTGSPFGMGGGGGQETASVAVATKLTAFVPSISASTESGAGKVNVGGVVSWTVTVKLGLGSGCVLPASSVAVQMTRLSPSGNTAGS